ncbi:glycogen debranching protein GlgX [Phragmitibacter flavus]|uniref:Glycogen debranching protein GlgX n=1 Tax=Phragmitibacter flavus TaxID=2576071 RepID=A0A5R8K7E0_9BACT|nr:glycogen debranching protein GlgX [Phragmitibacter flavus]TLD68277.1 glycogen debranching protein GlgX [Phragmitibacter flavus]
MNNIETPPAVLPVVHGPVSSLAHFPLGATLLSEGGIHFGVYSKHAEQVELCLYDVAKPSREIGRVQMVRDMNDVWRVVVPGIGVGALYGFRVHGEWKPQWGWWFNPRKLLVDPYAKAIQGSHEWDPLMQNLSPKQGPDWQNHGRNAMKSVVVDDAFDWQGVKPPGRPWEETMIYELHVRGFTKSHPDVPSELRGTYAGLAHPASVQYLKEIGVTAVQLLPVHQHLDDGFLLAKDLTNYWGYNSMGFFAPHPEYAMAKDPQELVNEFKTMVRDMHREGIEVILDVVYNHTAEGDENGPLIFLRGIDNPSYYLLNGDRRTVNYTGTGNTVNAASSPALRLIMDSLRYWVQEMHVDGFRFDLGATLGRNGDRFNRDAAFFLAISQDPVLNKVKMIAEPWDIGPDGYQVGGFPKPWHELNGRYRDSVRKYWCGDANSTAAFAKRLCGSQDIFGPGGRGPLASVNFITSHDGFTLRDLWTYNGKHNAANGENNNDGDNNNHSWNAGIEGETEDVAINALRRKLTRAMLATTLCSVGVPFINAGDERWRTQKGNNNAYCQDNEISWMDWGPSKDAESLVAFMKDMAAFRRSHPALRRAKYFSGAVDAATGSRDIAWFNLHGLPMTQESWHDPQTQFFAGLYGPTTAGEVPMMLLFNGSAEDVIFPLPEGDVWELVFDTTLEPSFVAGEPSPVTDTIVSAARGVACLRMKSAGSTP